MTARRPTYPSARKVAGLMLMLAARREGVDARDLADELGVSERTMLRYVAMLSAELGAHLNRDGYHLALRDGWHVAFGGAA